MTNTRKSRKLDQPPPALCVSSSLLSVLMPRYDGNMSIWALYSLLFTPPCNFGQRLVGGTHGGGAGERVCLLSISANSQNVTSLFF